MHVAVVDVHGGSDVPILIVKDLAVFICKEPSRFLTDVARLAVELPDVAPVGLQVIVGTV